MGYAHRWPENELRPVTWNEWSRILLDFNQLRSTLPRLINPEDPKAYWIYCNIKTSYCDDSAIVFDGRTKQGKEGRYSTCEPFILFGPEWHDNDIQDNTLDQMRNSFLRGKCKTNCRPYDLMVCATLILANHHAPGAWDINSDGYREDWEPAREFIANVTGQTMAIPENIRSRDLKAVTA